MDGFSTQPSGFKPFSAPPCPGCAQNAMTSQGFPLQPPMTPRAGLMTQMPTGVPTGPFLGTGPLQQGMMPQPGMMPQLGMIPQTGMMPQPGMMPAQQTPSVMQPPSTPQELAPILPWNQPIPVTTESLQYMNGFMRTQIGRKVTAEFLIGTNTLVDKTGTLLAVGANYILINEIETDDILLCDFYSIKFIKFYY